jgi:hypothetical protein
MKISYEDGDDVIIVYNKFEPTGKYVVYAEYGYIINRSDALWFKPEIETEYMYRYYEFKYGLFDLLRKYEFQLKEHRYGVNYKQMRLLNTYKNAKIFPIENEIVAKEYAKKLLDKYKYDNVVKNMNKDELFDYALKRAHYLNEPLMNAVKKRKVELDHEN